MRTTSRKSSWDAQNAGKKCEVWCWCDVVSRTSLISGTNPGFFLRLLLCARTNQGFTTKKNKITSSDALFVRIQAESFYEGDFDDGNKCNIAATAYYAMFTVDCVSHVYLR